MILPAFAARKITECDVSAPLSYRQKSLNRSVVWASAARDGQTCDVFLE
jgi:hypothetical protein